MHQWEQVRQNARTAISNNVRMKLTRYIIAALLIAFPLTSRAANFYKYIDRDGLVFWLENPDPSPRPPPQFYKYVDKNGFTFWVDDVSKMPAEYRTGRYAIPEDKGHGSVQYSIPITIRDNRVIVPVTIKNNGRSVKANMILDTSTPVTTLYSALASELTPKIQQRHKKKQKKTKKMKTIVKRGESPLTHVDFIEMDNKMIAASDVVVVPHTNFDGDGVLGNSFLRFLNYTVDYDNQLLKWH